MPRARNGERRRARDAERLRQRDERTAQLQGRKARLARPVPVREADER